MADALLISGLTVVYGLLHSLLASHACKRRVRTRLGPPVDRFYRLGYNLLAIVSFLPILALLAWRPGEVIYRLGAPWNAMAVGGQMLAAALLSIGLLQSDAWSFLGLRQLTRPAQSSSSLIASGLYRWVRHPLYTAGLAFIWLVPWMTSSLLALNLVLTAYVITGSRLEEGRLLAEFGEAYREYQREVPSLIPFRVPPRR